MNCKQFEIEVADWVKGRAVGETAVQMERHSAGCSACARLETEERSLLAAVGRMAAPRAVEEMWPKVAARLDRQAPARRPLFGKFAFAGTLAAGALAAVLFVKGPGPTSAPQAGIAPTNISSNGSVITMVAEMRSLPDPDQEVATVGLHNRSDLILGGRE